MTVALSTVLRRISMQKILLSGIPCLKIGSRIARTDSGFRIQSKKQSDYIRKWTDACLILKNACCPLRGEAVCLPACEPDLENIMDYGQFWLGYNAKKKRGEDCHCHSNSAMLWEVNKDKTVICTGYALSADGMWRQHSWLIHTKPRSNRVVETTRPRILYYGFAMTPEMCEEFADKNI